MIFENNSNWYKCKYLEKNYMQIYFALLLITLNVPLQIGKCTPGGICTPGWEPLFYINRFFRIQSWTLEGVVQLTYLYVVQWNTLCVIQPTHLCSFFKVFEGLDSVPTFENRVPKIKDIGSLQIHTGYLTFFLKKLHFCVVQQTHFCVVQQTHFCVFQPTHFCVFQPTHFCVFQPTHFCVFQQAHFCVFQPTHFCVFQPTHFCVFQQTHFCVFQAPSIHRLVE